MEDLTLLILRLGYGFEANAYEVHRLAQFNPMALKWCDPRLMIHDIDIILSIVDSGV